MLGLLQLGGAERAHYPVTRGYTLNHRRDHGILYGRERCLEGIKLCGIQGFIRVEGWISRWTYHRFRLTWTTKQA